MLTCHPSSTPYTKMENQDKEVPTLCAFMDCDTHKIALFKIIEKDRPNRHYYMSNWDPRSDGRITYRRYSPLYTQRKRIQIHLEPSQSSPLLTLEFWRLLWEVYEPSFGRWFPVIDCNRTEELLRPSTVFLKGYEVMKKPDAVLTANPRLSIETRYSIPIFVIEALLEKSADCPISMKPFKECDNLLVTSCYHIFDEESLEAWFKTNPTCPLCKQQVTSVQRSSSKRLSLAEKNSRV